VELEIEKTKKITIKMEEEMYKIEREGRIVHASFCQLRAFFSILYTANKFVEMP
jgi:hypothetical protein